jgi:hypothetical protein
MAFLSNAIRCLVALPLVTGGLSGQSADSTPFSVSGGVTALGSESRQLRVPGGHVQVGVSRRARSTFSSRLRFDVGYHSIEGVASPFRASPSSSVWIATGSVVKDIGAIHDFRPYVIASVGTISIDQGGGREAHLNVAGGAGIGLPRIGRVRPFIEGRFHRAMTGGPNSFIPLSLGVAF